MWSTILLAVVSGVFLLLTGSTLYHLRWARRLPQFEPTAAGLPRCSIVIAARDEESRIEQTVRRALAQQSVEVEVMVVDDRSADRTGEILERLAKEDARLRVVRVDSLPAGWLGKCHACHLAATTARHEWILFTDADCWLRPDVVARALRIAALEKVDHVALTPGVAEETTAGAAWHLAFLITVADWISRVNRDRGYLGVGAFNLVNASAYRECGGYEALRLTILDDVRLGLLLQRAGKRTRAFLGGDDVECHWGTTAMGMIKIMEKNYFAALDFRTIPALLVGSLGLTLWGVALAAPWTGGYAGWAAGISLLSLIVPARVLARRLGWSWRGALATPFIFPVLFYSVLNSTWVTLRRGGVRWRDTFYPLEVLRRERVH